MNIDELKVAYAAAEDAYKIAKDELKQAAIDLYRLKVGDKVRVKSHRGVMTGQVTKINVSVDRIHDRSVRVFIRPDIYPYKKDGSVALVGQIYIFDDKDITKLVEA